MPEPTQLVLTENNSKKKIKSTVIETHTEELIIGLCGPIGTDIHFVAERFQKTLENYFNYECIIIKLSELIKLQIRQKGSFDDNLITADPSEYYSLT